jgi:hypothetical protein
MTRPRQPDAAVVVKERLPVSATDVSTHEALHEFGLHIDGDPPEAMTVGIP